MKFVDVHVVRQFLIGLAASIAGSVWMTGWTGSALKISVVVWANQLLCQSQLKLRLSWAVTI